MFDQFPFAVAFLLFFCGAMVRGQATYWLARVASEQALRRQGSARGPLAVWNRRFADATSGRGADLLRRWGVWAIPLCYLTVGVQTVIIASAGVLRMGWGRFTAAQIPGALAWALIYTTIGFAVWAAAWQAALSEHPVAVVAGLLVIAGVVVFLVRRHRGRERSSSRTPTVPAQQPTPQSAASISVAPGSV